MWRQWLHIPPVRAHKHTATQSKSPADKHQRHGLEKFSRNWKWCFSVGELEGLTSLTILAAIKALSRSKRTLQFFLDLLVSFFRSYAFTVTFGIIKELANLRVWRNTCTLATVCSKTGFWVIGRFSQPHLNLLNKILKQKVLLKWRSSGVKVLSNLSGSDIMLI